MWMPEHFKRKKNEGRRWTKKEVKEAIKALKITIDIGKQKIEYNKTFEPKNNNEPIEKSIEYAKTAIEALEKQLPKKPVLKRKAYGGIIVCPICEASDSGKYCRYCGQKLDWSE